MSLKYTKVSDPQKSNSKINNKISKNKKIDLEVKE